MTFDVHVRKKPSENIVGKGENASKLYFDRVFYPLKVKFIVLSIIYSVVCKWFQLRQG